MADRFDRRGDEPAPTGGARSATSTETRDHHRGHRGEMPARTHDHDHIERGGVDRGTMAAVSERQRDEFGGIAWGSSFFGWLTAIGLGAILAGILSAIGASLALTESSVENASNETIG